MLDDEFPVTDEIDEIDEIDDGLEFDTFDNVNDVLAWRNVGWSRSSWYSINGSTWHKLSFQLFIFLNQTGKHRNL